MKYSLKLNKYKSIGRAVFVVEGDKKEHSLLAYVFGSLLDYSVIDIKRYREPYVKYVSRNNPNSQIIVVSSETSNIKSAGKDGKEYLDNIFTDLFFKYSLDITNSAVYYIFDRDNESNFYSDAEYLSHTLKNSRDNGIETNGLILFSYPCIESYIKLCIDEFNKDMIDTPKSLKAIVGDAKYQYSNIDDGAILNSCVNMLLGINVLCGRDMTIADLDDFSSINSTILDLENDLYLEKKNYMLLSLLSVAFMDLGIIELSDS